jgi:putative ribosome biogenesis GTPase RsgA
VQVYATAGYEWKVIPSDTWIQIIQGQSGIGNGSLTYQVLPNQNNRNGAIFISDKTHSIQQRYTTPHEDLL